MPAGSLSRAPWIVTEEGERLPREMGYRGMTIFKGKSDPVDCLYLSTYVPARGQGAKIMRSVDGETFEPIPMPDGFSPKITTLRLIQPFKGRMFTSPTGAAGGNVNAIGSAIVYVSDDPANGGWEIANPPSFGERENMGVFEMVAAGDWLYAGTGMAVILVSHNMEEVARLVNRLVVMDRGEICLDGSPGDIFGRCRDKLLSAGVDVPAVTALLGRLRQGGLEVDAAALTTEEAARTIAAAVRRRGAC